MPLRPVSLRGAESTLGGALASTQSAASRRLAATALATLLAASSLVGIVAPNAAAYNRSPKNCPVKSYPDAGHITAQAKLHNAHPKPGNDPLKVTAQVNGKPLNGGHVHYLFLYNGQLVSCQPVGPPAKPYFVHGVFRDVLQFPANAVLARPYLVVRVVIEWHGQRKNLNLKVAVHK
jgi:hypothetical protein